MRIDPATLYCDLYSMIFFFFFTLPIIVVKRVSRLGVDGLPHQINT